MITAVALDDEPPALQILANFCSRTGFINLKKTCTKTEEAFRYLQLNDVELLFLDINMPTISGLDFYRSLSRLPMVVFTTAYTEYAVEGFNVKATDYLLKPFTFERFMQAAEKVRERHEYYRQPEQAAKPEYIFLRSDYSTVKIALGKILFIEGLDDYLKIYLLNEKPFVVRLTLKAMLEKLPADDFIRVHRSYIISFRHIKSIRNKTIFIQEEEIPVGSSYEEAFLKWFNKKDPE